MKIEGLSPPDFLRIIDEIENYWGDDRTRALHHPMFVHEFRDTAYAIKIGDLVAAYMLACVAGGGRYGYIHLVAVRGSHRRRGLAALLYRNFFDDCRARRMRLVKAVTTPQNAFSLGFHRHQGFRLFGETIEHGVPVIKNYAGHHEDRVVMFRRLV
jgi:GNAT superfamily N-acetyltransferase